MAENLTFIVLHHYMDGVMSMWIILMICLVSSYIVALLYFQIYHGLTKK